MPPQKKTGWIWYADKLLAGAVIVACTVAVVSFWRGDRPQPDVPTLEARADFAIPHVRMPSMEPRVPDLSVDIATDPHEYLPRAGEHFCVNRLCTYIVPDGVVRCPRCGAVQNDRDGDGMDDEFEEAHAATDPDVPDGDQDYDGDKFTNLEEYREGSNPDDPNSIPAPIKLVGVGRENVDVLFRGFAQSRTGERVIQLNWGHDAHTKILPLGSIFRGYTLVRLVERPVRKGNPAVGIDYYTVTDYDLTLARPGGGELVLPRGQYVPEPERYGVFVAKSDPTSRIRAYAGMTVEAQGHSFFVVEVSPYGARLTGDRGETYTLELRPE
jgi:hypothetical protein